MKSMLIVFAVYISSFKAPIQRKRLNQPHSSCVSSSVNHLGNGEKKSSHTFFAFCGMTDFFSCLDWLDLKSSPKVLPFKNPLFSAMIHQLWPPFISPPVLDWERQSRYSYSVKQILQVSSLDTTFVFFFKGPFFPFLLCEILLPPCSLSLPLLLLCARVQLTTAGELIITSIIIIVVVIVIISKPTAGASPYQPCCSFDHRRWH